MRLIKYWPWAVSIVFHFLIISSLSRTGGIKRKFEEIREVKYLEETPRVNPKVRKVLKEMKPTGHLAERKEVTKKEPIIEALKPQIEPPLESPKISLKESRGVLEMEAKINLKSLAPPEDLEGVDKVIRISGKGVSTEEILKAPPPKIELKEGGAPSTSELLAGPPGGGEIKLEAKPPEIKGIERVKPASKPIELKPKKGPGGKETRVRLSGPIKERKITKKVIPPYPKWARRKGVFGTVSFKFWVTPDGFVKERVVLLYSSGYPELDKIAERALKQWKFEPIETDEIQWGIVTFIFELE